MPAYPIPPLTHLGEARRLLGLIERHDWHVGPFYDTGSRLVFTDECRHIAPTLIEALTQASRCPQCTNQREI